MYERDHLGANALLDAAGSHTTRAQLWPLLVPPEYESFKAIERDRYRQGLPNAFDPDQQAPQGVRGDVGVLR